jgi:hypothetical protein
MSKIPEICHLDHYPFEVLSIFEVTKVNHFSLALVGGVWQPHWGDPQSSVSSSAPHGTSLEADFPTTTVAADSNAGKSNFALFANLLGKLVGLDLDVSSKYGTVHNYPTLITRTRRSSTNNGHHSEHAKNNNSDECSVLGEYSHRTSSSSSSSTSSSTTTVKFRRQYPRLKPSLNNLWPLMRLMPCSTGQPNDPSSSEEENHHHGSDGVRNTNEPLLPAEGCGLGGLSSLVDYEVFFGSEYYSLGLEGWKQECETVKEVSESKCKYVLRVELSTLLPNIIQNVKDSVDSGGGGGGGGSGDSQRIALPRGELSLKSLLDKVHLHEPRPRQFSNKKKKDKKDKNNQQKARKSESTKALKSDDNDDDDDDDGGGGGIVCSDHCEGGLQIEDCLDVSGHTSLQTFTHTVTDHIHPTLHSFSFDVVLMLLLSLCYYYYYYLLLLIYVLMPISKDI